MADETMETTKECACGECDTVTWCSREPLYVGSYVVSHIWLCNACVVRRAQERKQQQANEPRAIVQHFAAAMERKLAANDGVKGGWKHDNWTSLYAGLGIEKDELLDALTKRQKVLMALDGMMVEWENGQLLSRIDVAEDELLRMLDEANKAVLLEAADCANYLVMICDVCGALPATDERGR